MALQFLYSSWQDGSVETVIKLASEGVNAKDVEFILRTVGITNHYDRLPQDENNEDLTNTLYLKLPSTAYAIIRTGYYTVEGTDQSQNFIIHAYIQEENEEISPLLYAINNCFRVSLTLEEQAQLLTLTTLPETPFPRPQFKLSQAEIRKFFSQGRLRTLACLLQAVIDSHGNQRIILLNDSYPSLKYWFYGIHSCLPKNRTQRLTYTTYAYHKPDDCILICSAPDHSIDFEALAEDGNFVIDNMDDIGCGDIESANFANLIVHEFWEDTNRLPELLEGIEGLMEAYGLNVATAAGLYKLVEFDFEWFKSAHEIHYFLGKIGTIDKDSLEMISHKLWEAFTTPDFKFRLNEDNLPILAYMFRNTNDTIRWEIVDYIDTHQAELGIRRSQSFDETYCDLKDKLPFVNEFIPITPMLENRLITYCEDRNSSPAELATFLYIIVENYDEYKTILGEATLHDNAIRLFEKILYSKALDIAYAICAKSKDLPYDFLRYVLIQGILNDANDLVEEASDELRLEDEFVYSIARLLITRGDSLALELVKNHAREGKYSETTLRLYNDLRRDFPKETEDFDEALHERTVYADFVTDSAFYKFSSLQHTTRDELTDFLKNYHLTGMDRYGYFPKKLLQHFNGQNPITSIEDADYFLSLLTKSKNNPYADKLFIIITNYLTSLSAIELFDYYHQNVEAFDKLCRQISSRTGKTPAIFSAAELLIILTNALQNDEENYHNLIRKLISYRVCDVVSSVRLNDEYGKLFIDKLIRLSEKLPPDELTPFANEVFAPVFEKANQSEWIISVVKARIALSPHTLYPMTAQWLIRAEKKQSPFWAQLAEMTLDTVRTKQRREIYRLLVTRYSYAEKDTELLKKALIRDYCRRISFIKRIFSRPKKRLFKKLP